MKTARWNWSGNVRRGNSRAGTFTVAFCSTPLRTPRIAAVLTFLIAAMGATALVWRFEQDRLRIERVHITNHAGDHAHAIERHIANALSAAYALAALVRQGNGQIPRFTDLAQEMLPFYPGVSALGLAPEGVVRVVIPLADNEKAIGHDLFKDPTRNKEAVLARDTGQLTLAGPFNLVQGKLGAVGRLPVFLDDGLGTRRFWGFTFILIRFPETLASMRLTRLIELGLDYELWRTHPDTGQRQLIAASSPTALIAPVEYPVQVPNATWVLSVSPAQGWSQSRWLTVQALFGLSFSVLLALLAKMLFELRLHKQQLERLAAELRSREDDLNHAQSVAQIGSWTLELTRNEMRWSAETYRLFGIPPGTLINYSRFLDCVHPEDRSRIHEAWQAALRGASYDLKHRIVVEGVVRWVHERAQLEFNAEGAPLRGIGTVQDITERVQVEQALQHSEERYRRLAEDMPVLLCQYLPDSTLTYVNQAYCNYFQHPAETLIGRRFLDFLPAEAVQAVQEVQLSLSADTPSRTYQHPVLVRGALRWQEWTDRAFFDNQGKVTHFQAFGQDITERQQAEIELRIAAVAFESQEGIIVTDAAHTILRVNRAFTAITGYSAAAAVGCNPSFLKSGRHDAAFFTSMWMRITQDGQWQGEIWNRRPGGEVYLAWMTITAVKDEHQAITHYVGTLIDITQRKAIEDEIKHLAFYDPLTQLPNRRLLLDRLHQALLTSARSQQHGALLFIDLDNFKTLNDTLGHDYGDLLLEQVSKRLTACVREGDTVARLGGDEFIVMLEHLSKDFQEAVAQTGKIGEKILNALNPPYTLLGHVHYSTSSIGVALFNNHQETVKTLLKHADIAMYQAKAAGRNTLRFFDPQTRLHADAPGAIAPALD